MSGQRSRVHRLVLAVVVLVAGVSAALLLFGRSSEPSRPAGSEAAPPRSGGPPAPAPAPRPGPGASAAPAPATTERPSPAAQVGAGLSTGLRGRVVSAATGRPLPGARIEVRTDVSADVRRPDRPARAASRVRAGADGGFALTPLAPGRYAVTVRADDHLPAVRPSVEVAEGRATGLGTVALDAGAFALLAVTDAGSGDPVPGAVVRVVGRPDDPDAAGGPRNTTDRYGRVRIGPLRPEGARLRLSKPGYDPATVAWHGSTGPTLAVRLTPRAPAPGGDHHPGLGIRGKGGRILVTTVVPGSAAERAGIVPGARVVAVDGLPAEDLPPDRVFALLQGPAESSVTVDLVLPTETATRRVTLARN